MKVRKDVYQLPAGDTTLQWYSKAVIAMKNRPANDPTSWNYQAAMHGFYAPSPFWQGAAPLPSSADQARFWNQCQHGSWFFLPWHRMYLAYFEHIVAKTIVDLGGPADWALPFWNYSDTTNPNARNIPAAFTAPAVATNGLWMNGRKHNSIPAQYVTLGALKTQPYTGDGVTSRLGFGGPESTFSHNGGPHGELESLPHDMVHVSIGGAMGDPRTAALDPIFWLHHANIDRLWQVWLNMGSRLNPPKIAWKNFSFEFHDMTGTIVSMTCAQVEDTTKVLSGYTYQGVPSGVPVAPAAPTTGTRLFEGLALITRPDFSIPLDITAATNDSVTLQDSTKKVVSLTLSKPTKKLMDFVAFTESRIATGNEQKITMLHFENVTGKGVPPIHDVYLNADDNENKEKRYAGSISFFGVEDASVPSLHHSGSGQHYALNISELIGELRSLPDWNDDRLDISIEPTENMEGSTVIIGRISLYSE